MAAFVPAASCGCIDPYAVTCSEPGCGLSACLQHAEKGWDDEIFGEGAPVVKPGNVGFSQCSGPDGSAGGCDMWICGGELDDSEWRHCQNIDTCFRLFCPACDVLECCMTCYAQALCNACAEGKIFSCNSCDDTVCSDCCVRCDQCNTYCCDGCSCFSCHACLCDCNPAIELQKCDSCSELNCKFCLVAAGCCGRRMCEQCAAKPHGCYYS